MDYFRRLGTLVLNWRMLPLEERPWVGNFIVGVIEAPETPEEAQFCEQHHCVRVRYPFGIEYERATTSITPEEVKLSFRAKIALFVGTDTLRIYDELPDCIKAQKEKEIAY